MRATKNESSENMEDWEEEGSAIAVFLGLSGTGVATRSCCSLRRAPTLLSLSSTPSTLASSSTALLTRISHDITGHKHNQPISL